MIKKELIAGAIILARQLEGALLLLAAANEREERPKEIPSPAPAMPAPPPNDLLIGAKAITKASSLTQRQIYHLLNKGSVPIWREPGLGIVASRSGLAAYFQQRAEQAVARGQAA